MNKSSMKKLSAICDGVLPSLLDREVRSIQNDAFGHRDLADALGSLIESKTHKPPYSIGLLGSWGSGKSSIKELYLTSLNGDAKDLHRDSENKLRSEKIKPITFNAWRFGGENIKRALIRHVYVSIGGNPDEIMDRLFRRFEHSIKKPKTCKRIIQDLVDHWLGQTIQILITFALIIGIIATVFIIGKLFSIENNVALALVSAAGLAVLASLGKELFAQNRLLLPVFNEGTRIDEPVSSAEQYEQLLLEQLGKFKRSSDGKKCERIVVFLDDLDRLSSEEMVAGLDAVRTFLEIDADKLPDGIGLIFVISCDEGLVAEALASRSKRNGDIPGTISDAASARRYLDRIFQFRLDVPDIPKQDMRTFVTSRMRDGMSALVKDLEDRDIDLEVLVNRLVHYDVSSPRNAIQLINAFSQSWWLACRREKEGAGSQRAGGLSTGAVTDHPIALAAICGLRVNFPEFYQDLLVNSEFIERFTFAFCRTKPMKTEDIPESVRPQLKKYANSDWELQEKYRPLRSYISSLQGLRWPKGGLMPLLQLSQDPISREFGPRERALFDAIRNGDTPALLEVLDLSSTNRPLTANNVRKVSEIYRELERRGTQVEQENALACFAGVSERLPNIESRLLLTPLARKIRDSDDLRWRVGISRIEQFLPNLENQDRREIAACLISDILNSEGIVRFQTEDGQMPSLDQAKVMAVRTREIVLSLRGKDGLSEASDSELRGWLLRRRISVEGSKESYEIPFPEIDTFVSNHEDQLLPLLSEGYSDQAINELEQGTLEESALERVLERIVSVFDRLAGQGSSSLNLLEKQIIRLLQVKEDTVVDEGVAFLERTFNSFGDEQLSRILVGLCKRIGKEQEDPDTWSMDWESGGTALVAILDKRPKVLDGSLGTAISEFLPFWSEHENSAGLAVQLSSCLLGAKDVDASVDKVVNRYIQNLFSETLVVECLDWTAGNFCSLNESHQSAIFKALSKLIQNQGLQAEQGERYFRFICGLPLSEIKSELLAAHFSALRSNLHQYRGTQSYLSSVFPVVPQVFEYFPENEAGKWLQSLFNDTQQPVQNYNILHDNMIDSWPDPSEMLLGYNPVGIFNAACKIIEGQSDFVVVRGVVESLASMIQMKVVDTGQGGKVAGYACKLWARDPGSALAVLQRLKATPNPDEIKNLCKGLNFSEKSNQELLNEAWTCVSHLLSDEKIMEVAHHLLQEAPQEIDGDNDHFLKLWLRINRKSIVPVLQKLIDEKDLNEDQSKRIWFQILAFSDDVPPESLLEFLKNFLQRSAPVIELIHSHKTELEERYKKQEDRFTLGTILIEAMLDSRDQATMNRLVEWAKAIGGSAVLESLKRDVELQPEVLETLKRVFPRAEVIKRLEQKK